MHYVQDEDRFNARWEEQVSAKLLTQFDPSGPGESEKSDALSKFEPTHIRWMLYRLGITKATDDEVESIINAQHALIAEAPDISYPQVETS